MSDQSDRQNDLMSLKTEVSETGGQDSKAPNTQPPREGDLPLLGFFAVGFAVLGIFTLGPVFVPLGLVLGIIALFIRQIGLGVAAIFLSMIGILTSPSLMALVGLATFLSWLGV